MIARTSLASLLALPLVVGAAIARAQDAPTPTTELTPVDESARYDEGRDPAAYQPFEGTLSPFGEWFDDPRYGRVWSPSAEVVGADFAPYATHGAWALSQYGWTWVSSFAWGWAPFHYGRWVTLGARGWAWVPGTAWGPAWVTWRAGGGYVGWAPLPPTDAPVADASRWRYVAVEQLGAARPDYVAPPVATGTVSCNPLGTLTRGSRTVHFNPGPVAVVATAPSAAPLPLSALPHDDIGPADGTPRPRMLTNARPWVEAPNHPAEPDPPPRATGRRRRSFYGPMAGYATGAAPSTPAWSDYAPPGAPRSGYASTPSAPAGSFGGFWNGSSRRGR